MIKKQFGLLVLLILFGSSSSFLFGQRGGESKGSIPRVTIHPTITHAGCFNQLGNVEYYIEVSTGWTKGIKINRLDLFDENWLVVESLTDNGCCGSISNLTPGMYTFYGSMTVQTSTGMYVSVPINFSIWLGIETSWEKLVDMTATPNSYSATRNVVNLQSHGGARSFNSISSGEGWIQMQADYGTTTNSHVYLIVGETNDLSTFTPSSPVQYVELFKTNTGSGVKVKYEQSGGGFTTTSLSIGINDPIRLVRLGSTLTIQKRNSSATVFTFPVAYSGRMNIGIFTKEINDAALDVVSSFPCVYGNHYHYLKSSVEESIAYITGDLKFKFEEDYFDDNETLEYEIRDINGSGVLPITGTLNKPLGIDFYTLDIGSSGHNLSSGRIYLITVMNEKGVKSFLKFKVA